MNEYNRNVLKAGINYILEGRQNSVHGTKIQLKDLLVYGRDDLGVVSDSINIWESKGFLKIIKDPRRCSSEDYCVEMLMFIDQKSPIQNWLNWI